MKAYFISAILFFFSFSVFADKAGQVFVHGCTGNNKDKLVFVGGYVGGYANSFRTHLRDLGMRSKYSVDANEVCDFFVSKYKEPENSTLIMNIAIEFSVLKSNGYTYKEFEEQRLKTYKK